MNLLSTLLPYLLPFSVLLAVINSPKNCSWNAIDRCHIAASTVRAYYNNVAPGAGHSHAGANAVAVFLEALSYSMLWLLLRRSQALETSSRTDFDSPQLGSRPDYVVPVTTSNARESFDIVAVVVGAIAVAVAQVRLARKHCKWRHTHYIHMHTLSNWINF